MMSKCLLLLRELPWCVMAAATTVNLCSWPRLQRVLAATVDSAGIRRVSTVVVDEIHRDEQL